LDLSACLPLSVHFPTPSKKKPTTNQQTQQKINKTKTPNLYKTENPLIKQKQRWSVEKNSEQTVNILKNDKQLKISHITWQVIWLRKSQQ